MTELICPNEFICHQVVFSIQFVDNLDGALGQTSTDTQSVKINSSHHIKTQRSTLAHEVGHCAWWAYTLNPPKKGFEKDETLGCSPIEEYIVSSYTIAFMQTMIDNPELHAWIFADAITNLSPSFKKNLFPVK